MRSLGRSVVSMMSLLRKHLLLLALGREQSLNLRGLRLELGSLFPPVAFMCHV